MSARDFDRIDVDGDAIECRWVAATAPSAYSIVLLHEGLGCVAMWRDFPERLAARTGCRVFAYSRLGYGGSAGIRLPRPLDYMRREARDFLPRVLDRAGIDRPVLLGHSDGATIALEFAAHHGEAARALVLMAPHVFAEPCGLDSIAAMKNTYENGGLRSRLEKYHGANVDNAFYGWYGAWSDPGFAAWNIEDILPAVSAPVLQIQGADDEYGTGLQLEAIAAGCDAAVETVLLDDCGHAPQFDRPNETLDAITAFVARLSDGR